MAQVFISYAHVDPDQQLALQLSHCIEENGFTVFVDSKIRVGQDWVEQIDIQLRNSAYFVVLLSDASVNSDMVRREIAIAYRLKKANRLAILPVRLGLENELPYDVGAYLDVIQYASWRKGEPFDPVCRIILSSIQTAAGQTGDGHAVTERHRFEVSDLEHVKQELARYVGPVARVVVDRAATKVASFNQLCDLVAAEIPTAAERSKFLAIRRT